jgi:hypothetical protein
VAPVPAVGQVHEAPTTPSPPALAKPAPSGVGPTTQANAASTSQRPLSPREQAAAREKSERDARKQRDAARWAETKKQRAAESVRKRATSRTADDIKQPMPTSGETPGPREPHVGGSQQYYVGPVMPQLASEPAPAMVPPSRRKGFLVAGAVGAFLVSLVLVIGFVSGLAGISSKILSVVLFGLLAVGFGLVGVGLLGAFRRTSAMARVTGVIFLITAGGWLITLPAVLLKSSTLLQIGAVLGTVGMGLASILVGVWALTATKSMSLGLACSSGLLSIFGGVSWSVLCAIALDYGMRALSKHEEVAVVSMAMLMVAYTLNGVALLAVSRSSAPTPALRAD